MRKEDVSCVLMSWRWEAECGATKMNGEGGVTFALFSFYFYFFSFYRLTCLILKHFSFLHITFFPLMN